jgi:hypothetical protein
MAFRNLQPHLSVPQQRQPPFDTVFVFFGMELQEETLEVSRLVRIPMLENGKRASFVEYELLLAELDGEKRAERLLSVWFTWTRLNDIDSGLIRRFGRKQVPSFPGRIIFRSETDAEVIEERRVELEAYLRDVVPRFRNRDSGLDKLLDEARPKEDFYVPRAFPHSAVVLMEGEEVWLGLVTTALLDSLKLLVALRDKLADTPGLEAQLGLLELNHGRRESAADAVRVNLPTLRRVIEAPDIPRQTMGYFCTLERLSRNALGWAERLEDLILGQLDDGTAVSSPLPPPPTPWTPPVSSELPPAYSPPAVRPPVAVSPAPVVVAEAGDSMDELLERADELLLRLLCCTDADERAQLLHAKRQLLEQMARRRERDLAMDGEAGTRERWRRAMEHVESQVVFSASLHDAVLRLEEQLYGLIDRRSQLGSGSDRRDASSVRRGVIALRRFLRHIKESNAPRDDDPALIADLNRVTDLQENAAHLQLDLEANFDFDTTMEDVVIDKLNQRVVESAAKEHQKAEEDMFGL